MTKKNFIEFETTVQPGSDKYLPMAPIDSDDVCGDSSGDGYVCSRLAGHTSRTDEPSPHLHAAHGRARGMFATWEDD